MGDSPLIAISQKQYVQRVLTFDLLSYNFPISWLAATEKSYEEYIRGLAEWMSMKGHRFK